MKLDRVTIDKINDLKILEVADKLGLKYSSRGSWRKALCFIHDDHTPSLGLNPSGNKWKCFSCGEGGSHIDLVMKHENLDFPGACEWLICEFGIPVPQQENRKSLIEAIKPKLMAYNNSNSNQDSNPSTSSGQAPIENYSCAGNTNLNAKVLDLFKGTSNEFTRALVNNKILTPEQMQHAAEVFRLSTADDNIIFWQIDRDNHIREGKVMYYQADAHRSHSRKPVTVSWLLKQEHQLPEEWKARFCLFGLHQLSEGMRVKGEESEPIIAIVESEKTAIICTELIPTMSPSPFTNNPSPVIWLATGGSSNLSIQMLQPLKGKRIIIFPDTDSTGSIFQEWLKIAQDAGKQFGHPITVSDLLERHASEDQKKRKIDIADFILESL